MRGRIVALVKGVAWLAIALLVALGAAGVVSTMNQPPGSTGRVELTYAGDAAMEPALDAATADLQALSDDVDELGSTARQALSQVVSGDVDQLQTTIGEGTTRLGSVQHLARQLTTSLGKIPYTGDDWALHVSDGLRRRYEQLAGTDALTTGLEGDWATFTGRSLGAATVTHLLTRHDEETAAAAKLGSQGQYREALVALDKSDATVALARSLAEQLAKTSDVTTLTSWLDRNAAYDAALRDLYTALVKSKARVTDAVRKAIDAEQAARAALPGDTRGLVVIMNDIAQGGLNQAVIAIEEARGALATALEAQEQLRDGTATPPG